jgi:DNA-binding response OmpR family regulator
MGKSPNQSNHRIFIVDDEEIIASTVALILQKQGYDASAFVDPDVALMAAEADPPDLLISDVVMKEMSGIDLAIRLEATCPACRVLLVSGQASTEHMLEAARAAGHNFGILAKPVHPRDLLLRVELELGLAS